MNEKAKKWITEQWQFAVVVFLLCSAWFDLKQDYAVHKATTELRIATLEKTIYGSSKELAVMTYHHAAIIPESQLRIVTERRK